MKNSIKVIPNAPLFRDPIYDGAADPTIIWNREEQSWWIMYTSRRAKDIGQGVTYAHGTDIGIASSDDGGKTWIYRGIAEGLEFEKGRNTFWAPEVIYAEGKYHMYVTYVKGVPSTWNHKRDIIHYTSDDLWTWQFQSKLKLSSDRVIDAGVYKVDDKKWKMWYKDEINHAYTYAAESTDLYNWTVTGVEVNDCAHEGPNVFEFKGRKWMITDPWQGLGVYETEDFITWERRKNILDQPGIRPEDGVVGGHADVLVCGEKAYIFYFTQPNMTQEIKFNPELGRRYEIVRSTIQVAELDYDGENLICDRDKVFELELIPEQ